MVEIKSQKEPTGSFKITKHPAMFVASWVYPLGLGDYRYWTKLGRQQ
jgi:hypothetical protein